MGKKEKRKRNHFMEYTNRIGENRMRGADCSIDGISRQKKGGWLICLTCGLQWEKAEAEAEGYNSR